MSVIGASLARAVGSLGGPATTTIIVVAGVAAGALGGGFVAGGGLGGSQNASAGGQLPVYPCPDTGPVIAMVTAGQQVLATGRSEDSAWLRIHYPAPGRTEAWVQAGPLTVDGAVASLPVAECEPELAVAPPSGDLPEESLTAILAVPPTEAPTATPTAAPTAGPTAVPTATPNARPGLASLTASTRQISFDTGRYCPAAVKRVTFRVRATDAGGVTGVTLFWREPGAAAFAQSAMSRVAGTATNGTWQVTLDTAANGIDKAGNLAYYAVATDGGGATRRIPATGSDTIQVKVCVNQGPTVTAVTQPGGALYWDPLGAGRCQTALNVVATAKDTDGVASATLFYRKPGSAGFQSKPMNNTTIKGKWYANLDSLGDKISVVSAPNDPLRWYVRATDKTGLTTNSTAKVTTVRRCDTEADLSTPFATPTPINSCRATYIYANASDPDGINGSSAKLVYTYQRKDGSVRNVTVQMNGSNDGRWYYTSPPIQPGTGWATDRAPFSFYVVTTDAWGGTTRSQTGQTTVSTC